MTDKLQSRMSAYFLAGFPCMYMDSVEDLRAVQHVRSMASEAAEEAEVAKPYQVVVWRATTGLNKVEGSMEMGKETQLQIPDTVDLRQALSWVSSQSDDDPTVGIFLHLRKYMDNAVVIQTMLDSIFKARSSGHHLVLAGPGLTLPPELRPLVTVYDFPLPDKTQIREGVFANLVMAYESDMDQSADEVADLLPKAAEAALGMTWLEAENAFSLSMVETNGIDIRLIQSEKEQAIKKSEVLEFVRTDETINDVGDFDLLKSWLTRRRLVFKESAREYGLPNPKGIMVVGPPGTGKSLLSKAVANYLELPLIRFDIGRLFKKFVGESEGTARLALSTIEAAAPVVVWFDELEKGFAGAASSGKTDSGVTSRVLGNILTWMQERKCLAFTVATVNNIQSLPPETYRAGRFDSVFATDLPQLAGRKEIFTIHIRKRNRDPKNYDIAKIAKKAVGFVGSEIEHLVEESMFTAFSDGEREFTTADILGEIDIAYPQSVMDKEKIDTIRDFCKKRARPVSSTSPAFTSRSEELSTGGKVAPKTGRRVTKRKRSNNPKED